ncbi:HTH-type transcriptional regulator LutR [Nocardioides dokdonensis FR1436]|uniref:HTH-type transcriptional regulator LutR n=1 Tax=Nocardioides dokdonensis FR1436 TaxID=1300347 RepID=A0A1A9GM08_9ACTN|nr:FCD domain-containing protein [Nocardioides dokdonensis]ANH38702.1 HTH-type transcriptional regulator LutR [Nocardioides dokdonensis FR1436]
MATMHEGVLASLGPRIIDGSLPAGSVITLEWLGDEYAVSRTVAREVVQVLASMNLVESRRRTGIRIRPRDEWHSYDPAVVRWRLGGAQRTAHLQELSQLRAAIEPASAALAAERATPQDGAALLRLAQDMETTGAAGDLLTFLEHDVAFHRSLLHLSGNQMFAGLCDVVEEVLRGRTDHDLMPAHPKPEARRLHLQVAQAVAAGEPGAARAAMTAICTEVLRATRDS